MKKEITSICFLILFAALLIFIYRTDLQEGERTLHTETVLFKSGDDNDINYRIPGIVALDSGTVIAYCEKRAGKSDWGDINIVYRVSRDGFHWEQEVTLAGDKEECTYNNPVMIVDDRGTVHCIYCKEYGVGEQGKIYYIRSEDEGMTWSEPVDISEKTLTDYRNAFATGPGHGICLHNGTLMVPVWMVPKKYGMEEKAHKPSVLSVLYSKDYGKTWDTGEILKGNEKVVSPNESTLLELSDGRIIVNVRNESEDKRRAISFSPDGISAWTELELDRQLQDPGCFGSLARYDNSTILFSNANSSVGRENITVKVS